MGPNEIRTVEEFQGITSQPVGVVVNIDRPTGKTTAHRTFCIHVDVEHFRTKVIDGGGQNGSYLYFLRYEDAAAETGAQLCAVCR